MQGPGGSCPQEDPHSCGWWPQWPCHCGRPCVHTQRHAPANPHPARGRQRTWAAVAAPGIHAATCCKRKRCAKAVAGSGPGANCLQTSPTRPRRGQHPRPSSPRSIQDLLQQHPVFLGPTHSPHPRRQGCCIAHWEYRPAVPMLPSTHPPGGFALGQAPASSFSGPFSVVWPWRHPRPHCPGWCHPAGQDEPLMSISCGCRVPGPVGCWEGAGCSWKEQGMVLLQLRQRYLPTHPPQPR